MTFSLGTAPAWLVDQLQSVGATETVTYSQSGKADVSGLVAVLGETTQEQIDHSDGTLTTATSRDFIFSAAELGRTPTNGDLITLASGEKYKALPLGDDEKCYRKRGDQVRVFTRRVVNA